MTNLVVGGYTQNSLLCLDGDMVTVSLSEFINNKAGSAVMFVRKTMYIMGYSSGDNDLFVDNSAAFDVYVAPVCKPGLSLSSFGKFSLY